MEVREDETGGWSGGSSRRVFLVLSREELEEIEPMIVDDRRDEVAMVEDRLVGWSAGHDEKVEV